MFTILKKKNNSVYVVMIILFITKILGFFKLRTIAQLFGVSHELDIFWAAFTIPDMLFMIIVAGSINASIIPILSGIFFKKGEKELNKFFNSLLLVISSIVLVIALALFILTPQITALIIESKSLQSFLNYSQRLDSEDFELFVTLTRIMMLSPVLLSLSTLLTGYLHVRKHFFVSSLAPLFYNLAMIICPIILVKIWGIRVDGIAWAAVLGSLLHFVVQIPTFTTLYNSRMDFSPKRFIVAFKDISIWKALKLAIPRIISTIGEQINVVVNTLISFTLNVGALSAYKFAISLHTFPINIIGSAVAQVSLPDLSESSEDIHKFKKILNKSLKLSLYLVLPIVSIFLILRFPIVRLAYGTGAFDWRATILTAWCLVLLTISVIGQTLSQILVRAFYALKETWMPLFAVLIGIVVNIAFAYWGSNFFSHYYDWRPIVEQMGIQISNADGGEFFCVLWSFIRDIGVWSTTKGTSDMAVGGLSLSLSISYLVEMLALAILLNRKNKIITWNETVRPVIIMILNMIVTSVGMYFVYRLFDFQLDTSRTISILILTASTSVYGLLSYWIGSKVFGIEEAEYFEAKFKGVIKKILKK